MPDEVQKPEDNTRQTETTSSENELQGEYEALQGEISALMADLSTEQIAQLEDVYYLWICWGDFHLYITQPYVEEHFPPVIIPPAYDAKTKKTEFVYPIFDYGNRFSTSPGEELAKGGRSTGKLLKTVEKIMALAIARGKERTTGDALPDIRVAFLGLDIAQRKAYKLCLDAEENVIVTNFEPGEWRDRFAKTSQEMQERGYPVLPVRYKF